MAVADNAVAASDTKRSCGAAASTSIMGANRSPVSHVPSKLRTVSLTAAAAPASAGGGGGGVGVDVGRDEARRRALNDGDDNGDNIGDNGGDAGNGDDGIGID
jgi:hypothetical protein